MTAFSHLRFALCMLPLACAVTTAHGQDKKLPLWEYGVSGFAIQAPAYVGAEQSKSRAVVLPWFIYRGEVFRADGDTVGARVVKTETLEFDVGFGAALGASSEDVRARAGMPSLGFQFEVGPRAKLNLMKPTPTSYVRLDLPYRAVVEVKDGLQHRGMVLEPDLKWGTRMGRTGAQVSASLVLADQRYADFLYGVPAAFATATRPAYQAKSGIVTTRLDANLRRPINNDWSAFGFLRYDSAGNSANKASPLFKRSGGASIGGGLVWTIGRSSTSVAD